MGHPFLRFSLFAVGFLFLGLGTLADTQRGLETQKEANIAYYARHRFNVVRRLEIGRCPPVWTLLREPRPT